MDRLGRLARGPFGTLVAIRLAYWLGTALTLLWAPRTHDLPPFRAYGAIGDLLFDTFAQWDAQWFVHIVQSGYDSQQSTAFFPLYPLAVKAVSYVVQSAVVAGVLVSLATAGAAAVVLARLARPLLGPGGARDVVLYTALYPIAVVFTSIYSEGLFLLLAAGSFLAARERRSVLAGALGALAVATRLVGLALLPALALLLWERSRRGALRLAPLLLLPAAVGAYMLYLHVHLGDAQAFRHAQGVFWLKYTPTLGPLGGLWDSAVAARHGLGELVLHLPRAGHRFARQDTWATWNVIQFLLLLVAAWLTWVAWRALGAAYGLYSAATLLILLAQPARIVPLVSLPRYLLADFPLLLALARVTQHRPGARRVLVVAFAAVGAAAAVAFSRKVWVA